MKYFTRAWAHGEPSDAENASIVRSYDRYIERITRLLPRPLATLARGISLHDALIRRVIADFDRHSLRLELLCGDLQVGYFDLEILYHNVEWGFLDQEALARRARDQETEILYDEVERITESVYEHRILFWPEDEIAIRFGDLDLQRRPRNDRAIERPKEPFVEVGRPG